MTMTDTIRKDLAPILYYAKLIQYRQGKVTEKEWQDFCMEILEIIMQENKDVLDRLKNV